MFNLIKYIRRLFIYLKDRFLKKGSLHSPSIPSGRYDESLQEAKWLDQKRAAAVKARDSITVKPVDWYVLPHLGKKESKKVQIFEAYKIILPVSMTQMRSKRFHGREQKTVES